ncbi:cytochrome P450 [Streptomyces phyllanthi]|uniref:Cytochrome P450 n=1 Tax=Streptomyces phyllanthi TaxID=1803180 RepID=A0A5N8W142_9ACTN|nr:cytochrome P450 [Streptomyces phyllanthi]MPY40959.1 cytochrome P450 [Streptomyces phyllanthi]
MAAAPTDVMPVVPVARGRRPLTGHGRQLNGDALAFVRQLRAYGPMAKIFIGPRPVYVVNSPELIREVLAVQARGFDKGAMFDTLRGPLGNGLITASGDVHRRRRRLIQPGFHHERIERYTDIMSERSTARSASWHPDTVVDLVPEINRLTMDILLRTLFATDPGPALHAAVKEWLSVKYRSMRLALSPLQAWAERVPVLPGWRPPDGGPLNRLRAAQQRIIDDYRADGGDRGDLLSMLLLADGPEGAMDDAEVADELITMFLAGTGTTSAAMAFAVHEVSSRPEVQARLQEEVDTVLGGRPPGFRDLRSLTYTRQVLTETLRLHPVSWLSMRRTVRPLTLGGTELPAGTDVFFSPYALHRDAELYEDPDRFAPERWAGGAARPARGTYLPFGAGNRLCVGEEFAWAQLTIALACFTSRWTLAPADGQPTRTLVGTVIRPERVPVTLTPRRTGRP